MGSWGQRPVAGLECAACRASPGVSRALDSNRPQHAHFRWNTFHVGFSVFHVEQATGSSGTAVRSKSPPPHELTLETAIWGFRSGGTE